MTWHLTTDPEGEPTLWFGDIAVLRECDLATGGGGSAAIARAYRRELFDVLTAVLAPDEATIERLCEALGSAHLEFYGDLEIPHWGRHLANAALAALAGTRDTDTEAGGGHG